MLKRIVTHWRVPATGLAISTSLLATLSVHAQSPPPPAQSARFDPSDVYFQGYLATRKAEQLEEAGDYIGASESLQSARKLFEAVHKFYPTWKSEMVTSRTAKNYESLTRLFPKTQEQKKKNQNAVAELEGGVKSSGTLINPTDGVMPLAPGILEVNPLETRRLEEAEAEVKRLKALASKPPAPVVDPNQSRNESRIEDISRQRDLAQAQLHAAEVNLESMRARLASAPMQNEVKALNQRIAGLEQERNAMTLALTQSQGAHAEAVSRVAALQTELKATQQKYADLDRDIKAERSISNAVVAGQRTQLQALEKQLDLKNVELAKANETIGGLVKELQESRDSFAQIRTERDSLLQERDQMSALLKLNENGRIQDLVEQNMGLAKNLREANEKVERLSADNNASKDSIIDGLRDLAIAKAQINRLQQDKRDQDARLAELEKRLQGEEAALSQGKASSDPAEVEVLRDIIKRQLRVQERRRQARDLLVDAVKELGKKDDNLAKAVDLLDGEQIQLTPNEQRLIADKNVDGEFTSPWAQDREIVGRNTNELKRDISILERTGEKSYTAGRLLPARELFEMIIEQHPGHIPTLCKLGVVELKLNDPTAAIDKFRRAVELETNNAYAHRMLGYALQETGDLPGAEASLKQSVDLAQDDAKSHWLLGNVFYRRAKYTEAEAEFKAAIAADPLLSDPYVNLSILCLRDKRTEAARNYYNQALERGAAPFPSLEQRLNKP